TVVGNTEGVDATGRSFVFRQILGPSLTIRIPQQKFSVDEPFEAEVTVFSPTEQPQTITFPQGILVSPDGKSDLEFADGDEPAPTVVLSPSSPSRTFTVIVTPNEFGTLALTTAATVVSSKGTVQLTAEEKYFITPLRVT